MSELIDSKKAGAAAAIVSGFLALVFVPSSRRTRAFLRPIDHLPLPIPLPQSSLAVTRLGDMGDMHMRTFGLWASHWGRASHTTIPQRHTVRVGSAAEKVNMPPPATPRAAAHVSMAQSVSCAHFGTLTFTWLAACTAVYVCMGCGIAIVIVWVPLGPNNGPAGYWLRAMRTPVRLGRGVGVWVDRVASRRRNRGE